MRCGNGGRPLWCAAGTGAQDKRLCLRPMTLPVHRKGEEGAPRGPKGVVA